MRKVIYYILLLTNIICKAQDCPNRIGDFIVNSTMINDLETVDRIFKYSVTTINNSHEYFLYMVPQTELNDEDAGDTSIYEIKQDTIKIKSWYNVDIATTNDSTRIFFIPNYKTDGISIKNVLLKFYDDRLYFIRASLSKEYREIIFEKYKGKGNTIENKTSPNQCKNLKFKKYPNRFNQYFFASTEDKTRALITMDFKINKFCEMVLSDKIEIFDFDKFINESDGIDKQLKRLTEDQNQKEAAKKEKILKRF